MCASPSNRYSMTCSRERSSSIGFLSALFQPLAVAAFHHRALSVVHGVAPNHRVGIRWRAKLIERPTECLLCALQQADLLVASALMVRQHLADPLIFPPDFVFRFHG